MIHSRPHDANWDRHEVYEFVFVADRLAVNSLRKYFEKTHTIMIFIYNMGHIIWPME